MFCSSHTSSPHIVTKIHNPIIHTNKKGYHAFLYQPFKRWNMVIRYRWTFLTRCDLSWGVSGTSEGRYKKNEEYDRVKSCAEHMWPILWSYFSDYCRVLLSPVWPLASSQQFYLLFYFSRGCHHLVCTGSHHPHPHQISPTNHLAGKYFWKTSLTLSLRLRLSRLLWTWRWRPAI